MGVSLQQEEEPDELPPELVLVIEKIEDLPFTGKEISKYTREDRVLARVYHYIQKGWPITVQDELKAYHRRRTELSTLAGCILLDARIIIPPKARAHILAELHQGHPGVSRMKSLARMHVWLPNIDDEVEALVKTCKSCQENQKDTPTIPLEP